MYGDKIGKCPLCGNDVIKNRYGYGCKNYQQCKFKINLNICGNIISKKTAETLLKEGISPVLKGFISKSGKPFDARLKINNDKIVFDFEN